MLSGSYPLCGVRNAGAKNMRMRAGRSASVRCRRLASGLCLPGTRCRRVLFYKRRARRGFCAMADNGHAFVLSRGRAVVLLRPVAYRNRTLWQRSMRPRTGRSFRPLRIRLAVPPSDCDIPCGSIRHCRTDVRRHAGSQLLRQAGQSFTAGALCVVRMQRPSIHRHSRRNSCRKDKAEKAGASVHPALSHAHYRHHIHASSAERLLKRAVYLLHELWNDCVVRISLGSRQAFWPHPAEQRHREELNHEEIRCESSNHAEKRRIPSE